MTAERPPKAESKCACRHHDARGCFEARCPPPIGDSPERAEYFVNSEECECPCHWDESFDQLQDEYP